MKKRKVKAMFVIVALMMPMMANAQITESGRMATYLGMMPKQFSYDNKARLTGFVESEGNLNLNIYNSEFEVEKTIILEGVESHEIGDSFCDFELWVDIDENINTEGLEIDITQTLFNDDEKYEYVLPINIDTGDSNKMTVGFRIMSEDGTELTRFYLENYENLLEESLVLYIYSAGIIRYGGNNYLLVDYETHNSDYSYNTYDSYLYKVDRQSTSVKAVANMPAAITSHFSLDGKRLSSPRRGINITRYSDGTVSKYIKK